MMSNNAKRLVKKVDKLQDELEDNAENAINEEMVRLSDQLDMYLHTIGSAATGTLGDSLRVSQGPDGGPVIAKAGIYGADYWRYVEFGTGIYTSPKRGYKAPTGGAPFRPIHQWVIAQNIQPDPDEEAETQEEVAWAIANSLSRGSHSHPFVRPVWRGPWGKEHLINTVSRSMQLAVNRAF